MDTVSFRAAGARAARTPNRPAAMLAAALAGVLLLALAAGALARLPWQAVRASLDAQAWPLAQATIRSVSLSERSYMPAGGEGPARELVLDVAYTFEVDGIVHEGRRASFADRARPHDRRLRTLYSRLNFAFVTGRTVAVAYDPEEPANAVLDTGFGWRDVAIDGGLGLAGGLLGLWLLLSPLRGARRPQ